MPRNPKTSSIWTPANVVTLARICLVPLFVVVLLSPWPQWLGLHDAISNDVKAIIAAGVFIVISCTDWIDGYLARSREEVTDFGKFLDPLADKILVAAALIALVELQVIPSWPVLIILTREFIVSGIRMLAASKGYVIAASWYGKAKTVFQIIAIVLFLLKDSLVLPSFESVVESPLYLVSWFFMIVALVLTVVSMLDYIAKARPLLFPKDDENEPTAEYCNIEQCDGGEAQPCETGKDADSDVTANLEKDISKLAGRVITLASGANATISTAESLTGGGIAEALTSVPGSSAVVVGGAVTYATMSKHSVLNVDETLLSTEGPVCADVAIQMAEGAAEKFKTDLAIAVTGIAGPTGAEPEKPIGTVFFGIFAGGDATSARRQFDGGREEVRLQTVRFALECLVEALQQR